MITKYDDVTNVPLLKLLEEAWDVHYLFASQNDIRVSGGSDSLVYRSSESTVKALMVLVYGSNAPLALTFAYESGEIPDPALVEREAAHDSYADVDANLDEIEELLKGDPWGQAK